MSKNIFANGREVAAIADDNESIAAMPDVCLSPPSPPAGPIPIPYPNFSKAKDTADGTGTVQIGGKAVGQKDKSYYKKSRGDEAATKSLGMGLVTHCLQGMTVFAAWSMDVKVENENVIRFLDLTTHNHMEGSAKKPPDTLSTTVSKGSRGPGAPDPVCVRLGQTADAEDQKIKQEVAGRKVKRRKHERRDYFKNRKRREKTKALNEHKKTTVSAMEARCGGKVTQKTGYSSHSRLSVKGQEGKAEGIKKGEASNMCKKDGKPFEHAEKGRSSSCQHTEGRFIEELFGEHGTKAGRVSNCLLTMSIKWKQRTKDAAGRYKEVDPLDKPCPDCEKTICHAIFCGMKIVICKEGKKTKPNCNKQAA